MSRRRAARRSRPELKLHVEPLEARWLLNADGRRPEDAADATATELLREAHSDAGTFAHELARHPRLAKDLGLGALAGALRRHARFAHRHGWDAALTWILDAHPHYAAVHHLNGLVAPRHSGAPPSTPISITPIPTPSHPPAAGQTAAPADPTSVPSAPVSPPSPPIVVRDPQTVDVGGYLDVTLPSLGLGTSGLTYTITPQPLPANMTFNRGTGELIFAPAPGQAGSYDFSVAVTGGTRSGTVILPVTVNDPPVPSTEVSGQVVDEDGKPLAGMPVTIGTATAITDREGDFTLAGIPANPEPIQAGGAVAQAEDRLPLTAPVPQLLGHAVYMGVRNVLPRPLIVPAIDWSSPSSFRQSSASEPLDVTNPAMPGFGLQLPANPAPDAAPASGTFQVAELPASMAAQHLPDGVGGDLLLYRISGTGLTGQARVTLPGTSGLQPGMSLGLLTFNPVTGGHDLLTPMVVSDDDHTLVSAGVISLGTPESARSSRSALGVAPDMSTGGGSTMQAAMTFSQCLAVTPHQSNPEQNSLCHGCQPGANGVGNPPHNSPASPHQQAFGPVSGSSGSGSSSVYGSSGYGGPSSRGGVVVPILNSDAGLVTGEYFLDHQLATYQTQGEAIGVDLQYSSAQADPLPIVECQFTTPPAGDSAYITSIDASVTLAGVSQGSGTTYPTPTGLNDEETYYIPVQVDASQLDTGVYSYTMTVTEHFKIPFDDGDDESGENDGGADDYLEIAISTTVDGEVNVVNASSDPYGAGWSIGGLQHLAQLSSGGPVLITAGQQGTERFDPVYGGGQADVQDLALASSTSAVQVLANDGTGGFETAAAPSSSTVVGTVAGDLDGDGAPDLAVLTSSTLAIQINDNAGGFTAGDSDTIPSGYQAKALAVGNFSGHSDGTLDLAVLLASTSTHAYSVAEYTGNGDGTFATPSISAAGNGTASATGIDTMTVADFDGDGLDDLAFNTDDGLADVMLASGSGSFGAAATLALPSQETAVGITATGLIASGQVALVVDVNNGKVTEGTTPLAALVAFTGDGSGGFSFASGFQTPGRTDPGILGLVVGDFQGDGLEAAVPITDGGARSFLDVVPLSDGGVWGQDVLHPISTNNGYAGWNPGNIVAADLNGTGRESIAMLNVGTGQLSVLVPDPASNQFLPMETVPITSTNDAVGMIAVAPFMLQAATSGYRGPSSDPSTLVPNGDGTWTRTYPDGTAIQFNSSGQETSIADRNGNTFDYGYVASGAAAGALSTITDPVGLVTTLAYDASGHLSTITDPADRVTTIAVDSSDDLTQIVDPDGAVTSYGYDTSHEADTETDPDDHTATAHYNGFGQLTSETLFDGTSMTSVDSAQSNGLVAQGDSGSLSTANQGSVTDPDGHTTTLTFNWMSHPTGDQAPAGGSSSSTYTRRGFVASATDAMGRITTFTYNAQGNVTSITEAYPVLPGTMRPPGQPTTATETLAYDDAFGVPTEITDFDGNTTTFTLDSHGNILEEDQPGALDWEWTYNSAGQVLTSTDPDDHTTTYTYDSLGRLTTITEPLPGAPTIQYTYDDAGDVASVTDEVGDTTTFTYDQMGRILTEQDPVQAAAGKEVSFTYDDAGNPLTATDAMGRTTTYTYNARNQETSVTDPMGRVTSYGYDATGNLTSVTDPMGRITSYTYDGDNDPLTVTDPMGGVTTYSYDHADEVTSATDPNGFATTYLYDNVGNLAGASEPVWVGSGGFGYAMELPVATYTYDPNGNLLTAIDGNAHTTSYAYNALNELATVKDADNDITSYTYDGEGRIKTVTDGLGHATSLTYDGMGDELTVTEPSGGGTTTMTYDDAGDLLTLTDPDGNVTTYTYTAEHQVATETTPTGGVYTYTYDLDGELTEVVDPDGYTIDYAYDDDGEETSETWVDPLGGDPLDVIDYGYDDDGELTSVSDNNASYQYTYDDNGRVTSMSDAGSTGLPSVTLDYGYDANGNRTSLTDSQGGVTSYTYDARNELTSLTFSGTGLTPEAVKFTYDNAGNMTGLTRYSNLAESTVVAATSYTYDHANRMTGITDKNSGGTTLVSYGDTYDAAGRVTQEVRAWASGATTDTLTYGYTNNDQLTSVSHTNGSFDDESFSWDANGNQTGTGYTTDTGNEQTASPGYTYTYDADGNMVTATDTTTGDTWTYTYDFRNRMTAAVETDSSDTVLAQVTYTYDALDNRIGIDQNGAQTWTLYDGSQPLLDFTGSGSLAMRYLNGPEGAIDTVLSRQSAGGTVAWYLPDRLGSIRDLLDNAGAIIDHVDYSAFGTVLGESSPSNGDRMMGFAGLQRDTVTGLNLAVHRVQNPGTGRWTSQDPIGFAGGSANLYVYVGNSPVNGIDPAGLSPGTNWNFFWDWFWGNGHRVRQYGPNSPEGQEMRNSPGAGKLLDAFYAGGCKTVKFSYGTVEAAWDTLANPFYWGDTSLQVGGFIAIAINNGDGTVTFRIYNVAGTHSFFLHVPPNRDSYNGMMTNIYQIFVWTEMIDVSRCAPKPAPIPPRRRRRPPVGTPMEQEH